MRLVVRFVIKSRETFFTSAQRSQIVWQILMRTRYADASSEDRSKVGINRLLNNGAYLAAFPLHDGSYHEDPTSGKPNDRRVSARRNNEATLLKKNDIRLHRTVYL